MVYLRALLYDDSILTRWNSTPPFTCCPSVETMFMWFDLLHAMSGIVVSVRRDKIERVFRIMWPIRAACLASITFWGFLAYQSYGLPELQLSQLIIIVSFMAFFALTLSYYSNLSYVTDEHGIEFVTHNSSQKISWHDIEKIAPSIVPTGGHIITTKRGKYVINGFVKGHQRLVELVITRAGLFPER